MPWQEAVNCFNHKTLLKIASEMESSEPKVKPIVLRWHRAIRGFKTGFQQIHGFLGCKTMTMEQTDGQIEFTSRITNEETVAFYPDEFLVGYALVPYCERNINILAVTLKEKGVPWVIEGPADVVEEVKAKAVQYVPFPVESELENIPLEPEKIGRKAKKAQTVEDLVKG